MLVLTWFSYHDLPWPTYPPINTTAFHGFAPSEIPCRKNPTPPNPKSRSRRRGMAKPPEELKLVLKGDPLGGGISASLGLEVKGDETRSHVGRTVVGFRKFQGFKRITSRILGSWSGGLKFVTAKWFFLHFGFVVWKSQSWYRLEFRPFFSLFLGRGWRWGTLFCMLPILLLNPEIANDKLLVSRSWWATYISHWKLPFLHPNRLRNSNQLKRFVHCKNQLSNEKRAPGCLVYIGDEILPSYIGIIISHYKDPY